MEKIKYGREARESVQKGVDALANAVKITLGPKGQTVMIDRGGEEEPIITKDGVTVAKNITVEDRHEKMGADLIRSVAKQAEQGSGDGTTTATVLTQAILKEGLQLVTAGYDANELKQGILFAARQAGDYISSVAIPVCHSDKMIKQVATVSANNDEAIGEIVGEAFGKVGEEGGVSVEEARGPDTTISVVDGVHFDRGMVSPYFSTNPNKMEVSLKDPYIMFVDGKCKVVEDVMPTLEQVVQAGRSLLIIAEDIEGQALATLVMNKTRGGAAVCAVKTPGFGSQRAEILKDMAAQTGGMVCKAEDLININGSYLGQADIATISQGGTVIVGAKGDKELIQDRVTLIQDEKKREKSEFNKKQLDNRIAKLSGGIAVIYVGGNSEVEMKEKMDRVIDAKEAVISALEEGVVAGGGLTLFRAKQHIHGHSNDTIQRGIDIVKRALESPMKTICENAGTSGDVVCDKVYDLNRDIDSKVDFVGYDAKEGEYVNMFQRGIMDPAKVTRVALANAASVASTILTTGCAIKL